MPPSKPAGPPPDRARLHEAALRHLARYSATRAGLLRVLERRITRWTHAAEGDTTDQAAAARTAAADVVARLAESGVLNDAAYAETRARGLSRVGRSARAIAANLAARGVDAATVRAVLPEADAELAAAATLVRKRRLGAFAMHTDDPDAPSRALATLARAGFSRDTATRALALDRDAAETLIATARKTPAS